MKKRLNYTLLSGLFLSFFAAIVTIGYVINTEIEESKAQLNTTLSFLLELAAKENGMIKNKNVPKSGNYKYDPQLLGTYETRTFRTVDTIFIYQHKIVDMETETTNTNQHFLLLSEQLNSKDIQTILDSILIDRKIDVRAAIGICSSGYPIKQLPWSGDTLSIHQNGCAQYTMTDDFTQIHYTAYLEYTPTTIWAQMNKTPIALWSIAVLVIGSLLSYQLVNEYKKKRAIVEKEKGLFIEEKYIIFGQNRIKASPQSITVLQMFLDAEKHRIVKEALIELWAPKGERVNNMYTAIARTNKLLNEIGCHLEIATDPKDREFYLLQPTVNQEVDNSTKTSE